MFYNYENLNTAEQITFALRSLYTSNSYKHILMDPYEDYDFYDKSRNILGTDSIITLTDDAGKKKALKPDITLSVVKSTSDDPNTVRRVFYDENVYRISKNKSSFKEIPQMGIECIGAVDNRCVGEVVDIALKSMNVLGTNFVFGISQLDIVSLFLDEITKDSFIRDNLMDLASEKNVQGITECIRRYNLDEQSVENLKKLLMIYAQPKKALEELYALEKEVNYKGLSEKIDEFKEMLSAFDGTALASNIRIDFSVIGDMKYYNGVTFKGYLDGLPGSVLSGGQYDKLMRELGFKSNAVGFAVYLDQIEKLEEISLDELPKKFSISSIH